MGNSFTGAIVTVLVAVIGVAIIAVLVKSGNQTASVLKAAGSSFGGILSIAENPGGSSPFGSGGSILSQ
jgi:hypothetical protein